MKQDDTSPSTGSASGTCSSPRHAMEQVVDADVDVDISQLSQLSLVHEVDEAMEAVGTGTTPVLNSSRHL
jgi:metal-sulfur cluster biosynthetic enzyme